jgi:hypothetical protein
MNERTSNRLQAKTPEQGFLRVLEDDSGQSCRVAEAILAEAQACLLGESSALRPGQVRVLLVSAVAGHGNTLRQTETKEVVWTIDAG